MSKNEWRDWILAGVTLVIFLAAALFADRLHDINSKVDGIDSILDITDSSGWPPSHLDSVADAFYRDMDREGL